MEKKSRTSKISAGFNDSLDIDKLANIATQMTASASVPVAKKTLVPAPAKVVRKEEPHKKETPLKRDRRLTIIVPHTTYMKMVLKTKEEGITFQKYINELIENDRA